LIVRISAYTGQPVSRIVEDYTTDDLGWLAALWKLEPWGTPADDARCGIMGYAALAAHTKNSKPADFMPIWYRRPAVMDQKAGLQAMLAWAASTKERNDGTE
jgi:hypothetical protein